MNHLPGEKPRKLVVKQEAETDPNFGSPPGERDLKSLLDSGIIVIDKPKGPTSTFTADSVKRIIKQKKVGYSGTLDPIVTGILPVGLNNATKFLEALLYGGKEYVTFMKLHEKVTKKRLNEVLKEFTGKIYQTPPVRSAVKREQRVREVYYIDLLEFKGKNVLFKVGCESGTYIRRLCHDIGEVLGTGAHMQQLRRSKTSTFNEDDLCNLYDLIDAYYYWKEEGDEEPLRSLIHPPERCLDHLPKIYADDGAINSLTHGGQLAVPGIIKLSEQIKKGDKVAVFSLKEEAVLLGTAQLSTEAILKQEKGIAVKTDRVLMDDNVYSRINK